MRLPGRDAAFPVTIGAIAFAFLGLFFVYPLYHVFSASLFDPSGLHFAPGNYVKVLASSFYLAPIGNTLTIGVLATLLTTMIAVPLAFAIVRMPIAGKPLMIALATLPLLLPSFVRAYALVLILGRS